MVGARGIYDRQANEQLAREYEVLKWVMNQRLSRQGKGGGGDQKSPVRHPLESSLAGKPAITSGQICPEVIEPRVKAAQQLGVARRTLDKSIRVVEVIDRLKGAGHLDAADHISRNHFPE